MTTCLLQNLLRSFSFSKISSKSVLFPKYLSQVSRNEIVEELGSEYKFTSNFQSNKNEPQEQKKVLKVSIIGTPNAGKSTLINQIAGRRIFAISKKVHTTRHKARAVHVIGNTQLVFLDTPGLVTHSESVKYKLEKNFMTDGENAVINADVIGVMHDVSNTYTRTKLDTKVLRLLHLYPKKNMFLILNKIDCVKKKRELLDLVDKLTCKKLAPIAFDRNFNKCEQISETEIERRIKKESGWSGFQEVFMVCAIEGFGIGGIVEYLMKMARPGPWLYSEDVFTDQLPERIIEEAVRSKLLDYVPQEMPYKSKTKMEYFNQDEEGNITAVVLVTCPSPRVEKLIRGGKDGKLRIITEETSDDLKNTFQRNVDLKIVVTNIVDRSKL